MARGNSQRYSSRTKPQTVALSKPKITRRKVGAPVRPRKVMSASGGEGVPHLYLDTSVVLDAILNRRRPSVVLMQNIQSRGWRASTSHFTVLRFLDHMQEERFIQNRLSEGLKLSQAHELLSNRRRGKLVLKRQELQAIYDEIAEGLQKYPFINFYRPLAKLWDDAEEYAATTNIGAVDAIHLAAAVGIGCHILVTNDEDLRPIARKFIPAEPPETVDRILREHWGFNF